MDLSIFLFEISIKNTFFLFQLQLLLPLVKKLTNIVETKLLIEHSVDETNIMIGQIALFSLKLLCRRLAGRGVKEFQHVIFAFIYI